MRIRCFINSAVAFCAALLFYGSVLVFYGQAGQAWAQSDDSAVLSKLQNEIFALEEKIGALTGRQEELEYQLRRLQENLQAVLENPPARAESATSAAGEAANKDLADRIRRLEEQDVNGRLEKLLNEDILNRLQQLEESVASGASGQAVPESPSEITEETPEETDSETAVIEIYQAAFGQLTKRQYEAAAVSFKDFLAQYGSHPLAANAAYWLGESYYVRRDYKSAAEQFLLTYNNYPEGGKRFDALLKLSFSLRALGAEAEACKVLAELLNPASDSNNRLTDNIRARAEKEQSALKCQ